MADAVKTHRGLTTERVVDGALQTADEGGIEALSLRRLARVFDVTPMAIYRHVRNKSHLLDLMAVRLLEAVDLAADESATWQDRLRRLLGSYQSVAAAHPAAPFLLSRPFVSVAEPRVTEALFGILHSAGFDARQSARLLQVMSGMVLGPALHRAAWAAASRDRSSDRASQRAPLEAVSADQFVYTRSAEQFLDWSPGPEADRLTIELLIGGLEAIANKPKRGGAARNASRPARV
jgi:TetR/AcrR family tetracycline transcriptional repressor